MARGSIKPLKRKGKDSREYVVWQARVPAGTVNGKRRQLSKNHRTKTEAEKWRVEQLAKLTKGERIVAQEMTVAELFARWLPLHERDVRGSTARSDRWGWSVVEPVLGHLRLDKLSVMDLQRFYDGLALAPGSINTLHRVLAAALDQAVDWELLERNPAKKTRRPKVPKATKGTWTADEAQAFLAATRDDFDGPLFALLLWTGMRIGEACALDWRHVDLEAGWVAIERTMTYTAAGEPIVGTDPKSASSRRRVPLPVPAQAALTRQRAAQERRRQEAGLLWVASGAVFDAGDGSRRTATAVRGRLYRIIARLGMARLSPHDFRHLCATLLLRRGVSPKKIQELLGHSSVVITMDLYAHLDDADMQDVARQLEGVLGGGVNGQEGPSVHHQESSNEITASESKTG